MANETDSLADRMDLLCALCDEPLILLPNGYAYCHNLLPNPPSYQEWEQKSCDMAIRSTMLKPETWQALAKVRVQPASTPALPSTGESDASLLAEIEAIEERYRTGPPRRYGVVYEDVFRLCALLRQRLGAVTAERQRVRQSVEAKAKVQVWDNRTSPPTPHYGLSLADVIAIIEGEK